MATEHFTPTATPGSRRGQQDRTFENLRERLLAGLPVAER
jgi:hypothetical protein